MHSALPVFPAAQATAADVLTAKGGLLDGVLPAERVQQHMQ